MRDWSDDVLAITSSNIPISFFQWVKLINFYKEHKDEFDEKECQLILDKSESYRLYLNKHSRSYIEGNEVKL